MSLPRFQVYIVRGESMAPSLRAGDQLLATRRGERPDASGLRRGRIVAVLEPREPGRRTLKRVVGLPGETVVFEDGQVRVDSVVLREPYVNGGIHYLGTARSEWRLGDGEYFVMGDNRLHSSDSREYGPAPVEQIVALARLRYWPVWRATPL